MTGEVTHNFSEDLDETFRKSFVDCFKRIYDKRCKKTREGFTQTESIQDVSNTFLQPTPGYVIRTSLIDGTTVFINICYHELVHTPKFEFDDHCKKIRTYHIPCCSHKPKENCDSTLDTYLTYDIIFHTVILYYMLLFSDMKEYLNKIVFEHIEKQYKVQLNRQNVKLPNLEYKGNSENISVGKLIEDYYWFPENIESFDKDDNKRECNVSAKEILDKETFCETSELSNVQGYYIHLQEFMFSNKSCCFNFATSYSVIKLNLSHAGNIYVDLNDKIMSLLCKIPFPYHLYINPTKNDNSYDGNINKNARHIEIIVPIDVQNFQRLFNSALLSQEDSGIDSDAGSPNHISKQIRCSGNTSSNTKCLSNFFDPNYVYVSPSFILSQLNNILMFTLNIKNAMRSSLGYVQVKNCLFLKCSSKGLSPTHYAFWLNLDYDISHIQAEVWDNNVTFQCAINYDTPKPNMDFSGQNSPSYEIKFDKCSLNCLTDNDKSEINSSNINPSQTNKFEKKPNNRNAAAEKNKIRSISESSEDIPLSLSRRRGILKTSSRSVSESSVDDRFCFGTSMDQVFNSDSAEIASTSLDTCRDNSTSYGSKKTVRFSEAVSKQLYRTNSSILGQKKKNQRKNRNKKLAHHRKLSESENSDVEDKEPLSALIDGVLNVNTQQSRFSKNFNNEDKSRNVFSGDFMFPFDM